MFLMDSPPLKRIYFDTNILYRWPHPPNDIYSVFGVAKWLGTWEAIRQILVTSGHSRITLAGCQTKGYC
jgi:hypothetical protein